MCQCCGVMKDYPDYNTFNRHQQSIEMIKAEYRRFESVSKDNILNTMYAE